MAAPAPHNVAALELRQINGMLDPPLLSALREHERARRLCLPWGLASDGLRLEEASK